MTDLILKTSATSTPKITEPKMRVIRRKPSIGDIVYYSNKNERSCFKVMVIENTESDRYVIIVSLSSVLKLDGTGLVLKAYQGMLYE